MSKTDERINYTLAAQNFHEQKKISGASKKEQDILPSIVSNLVKLKINLAQSNAIIAAYPSFTINPATLQISIPSMMFSEDKLISCFKEIKANKMAALSGVGFLYFHCAFLFSIDSEKSAINQSKDEIENSAKEYIKSLEMSGFSEQKNLQKYRKEFFFSSDLLDDKTCNALFQRLHSHCQATKENPIANILKIHTRKLINNHFEEILRHQYLVPKYGQASVKHLLDQYMTEYTHFEFATFAFLAMQGFTVLLRQNVDDKLIKAMNMIMAFFTKTPSPAQMITGQPTPILEKHKKMQVVAIEYGKKKVLPDEKVNQANTHHIELIMAELIIKSNLPDEMKLACLKRQFQKKMPPPPENPKSSWMNSFTLFTAQNIIGLAVGSIIISTPLIVRK